MGFFRRRRHEEEVVEEPVEKNFTLTFTVDRNGNYEVEYETFLPDDAEDAEHIARCSSQLINGINHGLMMSDIGAAVASFGEDADIEAIAYAIMNSMMIPESLKKNKPVVSPREAFGLMPQSESETEDE